MGRKTKLTPEVEGIIVDYISRGAYDWVAAEAAGITRVTFWNWMKLGEKSREGDRFAAHRRFFNEVSKAKAEARLKAESAVFENAPFNWLRVGPGRERAGRPGWTEKTQHEVSGPDGNPLTVKVIWDIPRPKDGGDDTES